MNRRKNRNARARTGRVKGEIRPTGRKTTSLSERRIEITLDVTCRVPAIHQRSADCEIWRSGRMRSECYTAALESGWRGEGDQRTRPIIGCHKVLESNGASAILPPFLSLALLISLSISRRDARSTSTSRSRGFSFSRPTVTNEIVPAARHGRNGEKMRKLVTLMPT